MGCPTQIKLNFDEDVDRIGDRGSVATTHAGMGLLCFDGVEL